jgi:hypothetical protein
MWGSFVREAPMTFVRHLGEWQGETYTVEPLRSISRVTMPSPLWAVFHRGEFIGTLSYRENESLIELRTRCTSWLQDLLESPSRR